MDGAILGIDVAKDSSSVVGLGRLTASNAAQDDRKFGRETHDLHRYDGDLLRRASFGADSCGARAHAALDVTWAYTPLSEGTEE